MSEIISKLPLTQLRWLYETNAMHDEPYSPDIWRVAHSAFAPLSVVAHEVWDNGRIVRSWLLDTGVPGIDLPHTIIVHGRPAPPKLVMVDARSIRPGVPSKPLVPTGHWQHFGHVLTEKPHHLYSKWDRWLGDKFYVYRDSSLRRVARAIRRGFRRLVNWLRGKR